MQTRIWEPAVNLAAVTILAYLPVLRAGYIWEHYAYLAENGTLRDANGLRRIWFDQKASIQNCEYFAHGNSSDTLVSGGKNLEFTSRPAQKDDNLIRRCTSRYR